MTKQDAPELLAFMSSIWPKQYSPNMTDQRRITLMATFVEVFDKYYLQEVLDACKAMLKTHDDAPTVNMILNRCQLARETERINERAREERMDLTGLPEYHPWNGCFTHKDALDHYMADRAAGDRTHDFSWYCLKYTKMEWKPWAQPSLCRNNWPYITKDNFGGWRTDENGFCVPYTK